MSLEALLKPVRWVDEQVLRQYTKLAKNLEKKRIPAPLAAGCISLVGFSALMIDRSLEIILKTASNSSGDVSSDLAFIASGTAWGMLYGLDIMNTLLDGPRYFYNSTVKARSRGLIRYEKMTKIIRLPLLAVGTYLVTRGTTDLSNQPMLDGFNMLCLATSMYLKGNDPKILQKKPFWKRAYEWCKEKVNSPAPEPQPLPHHSYSTLEEYTLNTA